MLTTLKLRRLWSEGRYRAMIRDLTANRPEGRLSLDKLAGGATVAAALGLIRLRELNQAQTPLATELVRRLTWSQRSDGSWVDAGDDADATLVKTSLAARALADLDEACFGRSVGFLADQQEASGWGEKSMTTAIVLMQVARLADGELRLADALAAEPAAGGPQELDAATRWAWKHAKLRVGTLAPRPATPPLSLQRTNQATLAFAA